MTESTLKDTRAWEQMEQIPEGCIARKDAAIAAVIAAGIGVGMTLLTTGVVFHVFKETGNMADWAAAAGTWVIGYGAWKYAREAHLLRERELQQGARRDQHLHAGRVQAIREWAKLIRRPYKVTEAAEKGAESGLTVSSARGATRGALALLKLIPLDDEAWRYLSKDDVELKIRLSSLSVLLELHGQTLLDRIEMSQASGQIATMKDSNWPAVRKAMKDLESLGVSLNEAASRIPLV